MMSEASSRNNSAAYLYVNMEKFFPAQWRRDKGSIRQSQNEKSFNSQRNSMYKKAMGEVSNEEESNNDSDSEDG